MRKFLVSCSLCIRAHLLVLAYVWCTTFGLFIARRGIPPLFPAITSVLAILLVALSVYIYNDVMDVEMDRINKPDRPLAAGMVSKTDATTFAILLAIAGIGIAFSINPAVFLLNLTYLTLGFIYSTPPIRLKNRFLLKQMTVATGGAISSLIGGAAVDNISMHVLYAAAMFFVLGFGVQPISDIRDLKGDEVSGLKTLPIVWGPKFTIRFAIAFICAFAISTIVGYSRLGFNGALPILISCASLALIYVIYPLFDHWQDPLFVDKVRRKMRLLLFLFQISILLGALPI